MLIWFVLVFDVCVICGTVNKIGAYVFLILFIGIMGVKVCTKTECG